MVCIFCLGSQSCGCLIYSHKLNTVRIVDYSLCKSLENGCLRTDVTSASATIYKGDSSSLKYKLKVKEAACNSFFNFKLCITNSTHHSIPIKTIKVSLVQCEILFSQCLPGFTLKPSNTHELDYFNYFDDNGGSYEIIIEFINESTVRSTSLQIHANDRTTTTAISKLLLVDHLLNICKDLSVCDNSTKGTDNEYTFDYLYHNCCKLKNVAHLVNGCNEMVVAASNCVTYKPECVELEFEGEACLLSCDYSFCLSTELSKQSEHNLAILKIGAEPGAVACLKSTLLTFKVSLPFISYAKDFSFKLYNENVEIDSGLFILSNELFEYNYSRSYNEILTKVILVIETTLDVFHLASCSAEKGVKKEITTYNLPITRKDISGFISSNVLIGNVESVFNPFAANYTLLDGVKMTSSQLKDLTTNGISLSNGHHVLSYVISPSEWGYSIITSSSGIGGSSSVEDILKL